MNQILQTARQTLLNEGNSILQQTELLNGDFEKAVMAMVNIKRNMNFVKLQNRKNEQNIYHS
jgi:hypothetical protein